MPWPAPAPTGSARSPRLHALLVRGARFELARRRETLRGVADREIDDLATQAAEDALVAILAKLGTFRGAKPLHHLGLQVRDARGRRAGATASLGGARGRARPTATGRASTRTDASSCSRRPSCCARRRGTPCARASRRTSAGRSPHAPSTDVPIDVLAERLGTTRGALYKTLHDARRKLRAALVEAGARTATGGEPMSTDDDGRSCAARARRAGDRLRGVLRAARRVRRPRARRRRDADRAVPGMRAHLDGCRACREEHDSLRALAAGEPDA